METVTIPWKRSDCAALFSQDQLGWKDKIEKPRWDASGCFFHNAEGVGRG